MDHRLTPISCTKCGKFATFEFLYQDQRMCVMCYMTMAGQTAKPLVPAPMTLMVPKDDWKKPL